MRDGRCCSRRAGAPPVLFPPALGWSLLIKACGEETLKGPDYHIWAGPVYKERNKKLPERVWRRERSIQSVFSRSFWEIKSFQNGHEGTRIKYFPKKSLDKILAVDVISKAQIIVHMLGSNIRYWVHGLLFELLYTDCWWCLFLS